MWSSLSSYLHGEAPADAGDEPAAARPDRAAASKPARSPALPAGGRRSRRRAPVGSGGVRSGADPPSGSRGGPRADNRAEASPPGDATILRGIVAGEARSGKTSLIRRLRGEDPFRTEDDARGKRHLMALVPWSVPEEARKDAVREGESVQLYVSEAKSFRYEDKERSSRKQWASLLASQRGKECDFVVWMVDPRMDKVREYVEDGLDAWFSSPERGRYENADDGEPAQRAARPPVPSVCILLNFRDVDANERSEGEASLLDEVRRLTMKKSERHEGHRERLPTIVAYESSMKDGYGLQNLHSFVVLPYLSRKEKELRRRADRVQRRRSQWQRGLAEANVVRYVEFIEQAAASQREQEARQRAAASDRRAEQTEPSSEREKLEEEKRKLERRAREQNQLLASRARRRGEATEREEGPSPAQEGGTDETPSAASKAAAAPTPSDQRGDGRAEEDIEEGSGEEVVPARPARRDDRPKRGERRRTFAKRPPPAETSADEAPSAKFVEHTLESFFSDDDEEDDAAEAAPASAGDRSGGVDDGDSRESDDDDSSDDDDDSDDGDYYIDVSGTRRAHANPAPASPKARRRRARAPAEVKEEVDAAKEEGAAAEPSRVVGGDPDVGTSVEEEGGTEESPTDEEEDVGDREDEEAEGEPSGAGPAGARADGPGPNGGSRDETEGNDAMESDAGPSNDEEANGDEPKEEAASGRPPPDAEVPRNGSSENGSDRPNDGATERSNGAGGSRSPDAGDGRGAEPHGVSERERPRTDGAPSEADSEEESDGAGGAPFGSNGARGGEGSQNDLVMDSDDESTPGPRRGQSVPPAEETSNASDPSNAGPSSDEKADGDELEETTASERPLPDAEDSGPDDSDSRRRDASPRDPRRKERSDRPKKSATERAEGVGGSRSPDARANKRSRSLDEGDGRGAEPDGVSERERSRTDGAPAAKTSAEEGRDGDGAGNAPFGSNSARGEKGSQNDLVMDSDDDESTPGPRREQSVPPEEETSNATDDAGGEPAATATAASSRGGPGAPSEGKTSHATNGVGGEAGAPGRPRASAEPSAPGRAANSEKDPASVSGAALAAIEAARAEAERRMAEAHPDGVAAPSERRKKGKKEKVKKEKKKKKKKDKERRD